MEDSIIVYSLPTCGMCKMLKRELDACKLSYTDCQDADVMSELGISSVPVLCINGTKYKYKDALDLLRRFKNTGKFEEV